MRWRKTSRRDQGFALLIVLWTMVLLALLTAQITGAGRAEAQMAAALRNAAQLQAAADGAVYETIWHMLDGSGEMLAARRRILRPARARRAGARHDQDERGKMDINQVPPQL